MSTGSSIEWTDNTWNPVTGCTRVSAGCDNCYAVTMTHRLESMGQEKYSGLTVLNRAGDRHFNGVVKCHEDALDIPLRWRKPRRIFVNSMSDLFHKEVPFEFIDKVFAVMALCPQHTFQVLTKRPERMSEYLNARELVHGTTGRSWRVRQTADDHIDVSRFSKLFSDGDGWPWPLPNVWLGASVENQAAADERIAPLLRCPAAVRFLSCEPLLGPVDLRRVPNTSPPNPNCPHGAPSRRIDWVIVGGESGPGARPMHPDWARSIRDQCAAAGVPIFFKQWGEYLPGKQFTTEAQRSAIVGRVEKLVRYTGEVTEPGDHAQTFRIGKKKAGRLLDGREHNEYPGSASQASAASVEKS